MSVGGVEVLSQQHVAHTDVGVRQLHAPTSHFMLTYVSQSLKASVLRYIWTKNT
jgi:hypothetical protein